LHSYFITYHKIKSTYNSSIKSLLSFLARGIFHLKIAETNL